MLSTDVKELFFQEVILHQFLKRKNRALLSKNVQAILTLLNLAQKVPFLENLKKKLSKVTRNWDLYCAASCPIRLLVSAIMGQQSSQSSAATLDTGVHHGNSSAVITVTCHYTQQPSYTGDWLCAGFVGWPEVGSFSFTFHICLQLIRN